MIIAIITIIIIIIIIINTITTKIIHKNFFRCDFITQLHIVTPDRNFFSSYIPLYIFVDSQWSYFHLHLLLIVF